MKSTGHILLWNVKFFIKHYKVCNKLLSAGYKPGVTTLNRSISDI